MCGAVCGVHFVGCMVWGLYVVVCGVHSIYVCSTVCGLQLVVCVCFIRRGICIGTNVDDWFMPIFFFKYHVLSFCLTTMRCLGHPCGEK